MTATSKSKPFKGKNYDDLQPQLRLPKAIPGLPLPVSLNPSELEALDSSGFFSSNEEMICMNKIKLKDRATGKGFCAVVIDTGVSNHVDLSGALVLPRLAFNAHPNNKDVVDLHGHGTHVAGIIAGRGKSAAGRGIAPGAKILSIKITNKDSGDASWWQVWNALNEVFKRAYKQQNSKSPLEDRISVVNLSFNGLDNMTSDEGLGYHKIFKLIDDLHNLNVPVVVSGGNYFHKFKSYGLAYPAFNNRVISVGAVCNFPFEGLVTDTIAPFSQRILPRTQPKEFNEHSPCFVLAPGVLSASLDCMDSKGYTYMTGSSQAAPVITGVILMLQEIACSKNKSYAVKLPPIKLIKECLMKGCDIIKNNAAASSAMKNESDKFFDSENYQRVNVRASVEYLNKKLS